MISKKERKRRGTGSKFAKVSLKDLCEADVSKLDREPLLPFEKKSREVIIRTEAKTHEGKGADPNKRTVSELINKGIINLDKPKGPTSHQVSAYVQDILEIKKSGHSGTLDPKVSGILPTATESGTKVLQALLKSGKEYICICHLHDKRPIEEIKIALSRFIGKINQLPPIKSAVKRRVRTREIYYIKIIEIEEDNILFRVGCQAGTYIRKLCSDLGEILGTGAHMAALRRTKAGPFTEENKVSLQDLKDAKVWMDEGDDEPMRKCIQPIENAVEHLPKVWVQDGAVRTICHGASLKVPGVVKYNEFDKDQVIAVMTLKDELVCIATSQMNSNKIKKEARGLVCISIKVLMDANTYA